MVGLASNRMPCNLVCGTVYREMLAAEITCCLDDSVGRSKLPT
jgi:hypothetical protein